MTSRRRLLAMLAATPALGAVVSLDSALAGRQGALALLDLSANRLIGSARIGTAASFEAKPGSTLKPFALLALLQSGKLQPYERYACPRKLRLLGRHLDCSHDPAADAFDAVSALAYSCNCFVAHFAARLAPGELAARLREFGFGSLPHLASHEAQGAVATLSGERQQAQALGEEGILVTPLTLLAAYRDLARRATTPIRQTQPVFDGLEAAVESGTAQLARIANLRVSGKTGTATTGVAGQRLAWFAGYAPATKPAVAVVALAIQGSGGLDAAPLAAVALKRWQSSTL